MVYFAALRIAMSIAVSSSARRTVLRPFLPCRINQPPSGRGWTNVGGLPGVRMTCSVCMWGSLLSAGTVARQAFQKEEEVGVESGIGYGPDGPAFQIGYQCHLSGDGQPVRESGTLDNVPVLDSKKKSDFVMCR